MSTWESKSVVRQRWQRCIIRRDSSHCRYRSIHYQREPTRSPAPPLAQRGGKSPVAASLPVRAVRLPAEPRTAQTAGLPLQTSLLRWNVPAAWTALNYLPALLNDGPALGGDGLH